MISRSDIRIMGGTLAITSGILILSNVIFHEQGTKDFKTSFRNLYGGKEVLEDYSRGIRNNNPGNITHGKILWNGEVPREKNPDKKFKRFYRFEYGVRAVMINLIAYHKSGLQTITKIISHWAPASDNNDTKGYIRNVAKDLGVSTTAKLSLDYRTLCGLTRIICRIENGRDYLTAEHLSSAYKMLENA